MNRVTIKSLGQDLYQVNINGKGMTWPIPLDMAQEQAKNFREQTRQMTKEGIRY